MRCSGLATTATSTTTEMTRTRAGEEGGVMRTRAGRGGGRVMGMMMRGRGWGGRNKQGKQGE